MEHINIKIFGKVQGVSFRHSARLEAKELGIAGFACNEPDGSVYMETEGSKEALGQFLDWCKNGFEFAEVEKIESFSEEIKGFSDFVIK